MSKEVIQIVCLIIALLVLAYVGVVAKRRVIEHEDMSVGGRTFNAWKIFYSLFAFWGGNTIASIVELAHKDGVVSAWFGISRMIMFVLILFITGGAFRKLAMITLSNFIAKRFESEFLRLVSGIIIALNFTIFTVSSVVGAAAFFTVLLGFPVWLAAVFTVASFLTYTYLGGMHALGYNGKIITAGQLLSLLVAVIFGLYAAGWHNVLHLEPRYFNFFPSNYTGTILMWLFTFCLNAFVAQAALQIVMSCSSVREGRKGVLITTIGFLPIVILAPLSRNGRQSPLSDHQISSGHAYAGLQHALGIFIHQRGHRAVFYHLGLGLLLHFVRRYGKRQRHLSLFRTQCHFDAINQGYQSIGGTPLSIHHWICHINSQRY